MHECEHADDVTALLARQREVVDVEHRELGATREQQPQPLRGRGRLADPKVDALGAVIASCDGREDSRVDRVGGEIEHERRPDLGPIDFAGTAAPCEQSEGERGKEDVEA